MSGHLKIKPIILFHNHILIKCDWDEPTFFWIQQVSTGGIQIRAWTWSEVSGLGPSYPRDTISIQCNLFPYVPTTHVVPWKIRSKDYQKY